MTRLGKPRIDWTAPQLATLRRMAPTHSAKEIAAATGKTRKAVQRFAERKKIRIERRWRKFTDAEVRAVRDMVSRGVEQKAVAAGMRISKPHVSKIVLRRLRKAA